MKRKFQIPFILLFDQFYNYRNHSRERDTGSTRSYKRPSHHTLVLFTVLCVLVLVFLSSLLPRFIYHQDSFITKILFFSNGDSKIVQNITVKDVVLDKGND